MSDLSKLTNAELADHIVGEVAAMCLAPSGVDHGETWHALNWSRQPHRVLYDALDLLREAASRLQAPAVAETEQMTRALMALTRHGVPADIQGALLNGSDKYGINPGALQAALCTGSSE